MTTNTNIPSIQVDFVWQPDGTVAHGQVRIHVPGEANSRIVSRSWGYPDCDGKEQVNGCGARCQHADAAKGFVGTLKRSHKR